MKSRALGKNISAVEVLNTSPHGFWLWVHGKEYFLPYTQYPWFRNATVGELYNVELLHETHLHWPNLDIDLEVESLEQPTGYPLIYKK